MFECCSSGMKSDAMARPRSRSSTPIKRAIDEYVVTSLWLDGLEPRKQAHRGRDPVLPADVRDGGKEEEVIALEVSYEA
jgi:hypothetical protein